MDGPTIYETRGPAGWITLNQPERRNALSDDLVAGLENHLQTAMQDNSVRVVVITGAGSAFCAGADLKAGGVGTDSDQDHPFARLLKKIWQAPKPVIGRINGHAFGGGIGLAAVCDIAIAADAAKFSFSEVRVGVVPAMISVVVIPKIGVHHAMRLFLTGERFTADEAVGYGLLHRVVPTDALDETVDEFVTSICHGGPNAIAAVKKLVRTVPQLSMEDGFRHTAELISKLFSSDEAREGMEAFLQKRRPQWAPTSPKVD